MMNLHLVVLTYRIESSIEIIHDNYIDNTIDYIRPMDAILRRAHSINTGGSVSRFALLKLVFVYLSNRC